MMKSIRPPGVVRHKSLYISPHPHFLPQGGKWGISVAPGLAQMDDSDPFPNLRIIHADQRDKVA